ncbi:hypothetical protein K502DRAFT_332861 [Neoconidiobolus thromboides FSU 785]|nr:hypothetical protein K502DRAFT_332861 [Neoconidiobolus thromboides FSU 785]
MATYYFTNSSHLFNDLISNSRIVTYSKKYSGDIKIEITPTITLQLIELYFAHLNNFFPLINPTSFYSQLNNAKKHDHPFLALLNIVCLSGASYYPNRTVARIISTYYASKVQTYFKKIYLKPSLNSIQAYLLASYHISLCENDTVIENAWYYLGLAKRMLSIFYYQSSPIRSQHVNSSFENQSWIMFCCEAILSYSFGRPNYITQDETSLSKAKFYLPSVNFTAANIFLVKELASLDPTLNLKFFKQFCYHCIFLSQWSILKDNYGLGNGSKLRLNYESKQQLLNDSIKNHVYLLENEAIRWYLRLPRFDSGRTNPDAMQLPNGKDIHKSYLAALHFSFLIDLNKPFITKAQTVGLAVPIGDSLSLEDYYSKNSLERCLLCAFFGTQVVMDSNERIVEIAIPFFWYCALQFTFIFVYVIRNFEKNHWALNPSRKNGLFLYRLIEKYSDKWVLTRDTFQIVQSILVEGESFFFN